MSMDGINVTKIDLSTMNLEGEFITASYTVSDATFVTSNFDMALHIKKQLTSKMIEELVDSKYVEYTKISNPNFNTTTYFARMVLADKANVQALKKKLSNG